MDGPAGCIDRIEIVIAAYSRYCSSDWSSHCCCGALRRLRDDATANIDGRAAAVRIPPGLAWSALHWN